MAHLSPLARILAVGLTALSLAVGATAGVAALAEHLPHTAGTVETGLLAGSGLLALLAGVLLVVRAASSRPRRH